MKYESRLNDLMTKTMYDSCSRVGSLNAVARLMFERVCPTLFFHLLRLLFEVLVIEVSCVQRDEDIALTSTNGSFVRTSSSQ